MEFEHADKLSPRAPRTEGPRTTLRLPKALVEVADKLAHELGVSRNEALIRLATRGASLYELEQSIAVRREQRWAAVLPGVIDTDHTEFPSPAEARDAIFSTSDDSLAAPAG